MSYLGSWKIDDVLTFPAITHRFDTGALTDADAVPAYRVYEDETGTALLTGNMAKLDDANTTGFYTEAITLSAANGFEKGKCYTIYISAAVNSVTGGQHHTFQIEAEVDANTVSGAVPSVTGNVGGNVTGTIGGLTQAALADFFDTDSGTTYAAAVAGSVVKEIADNAGGSALTEAGIADAVWDEARAGHVAAGSFGEGVASVQGNVVGTIGGLTAAALADFFDTNSGTTYAAAVAGSVVKETADNAGGASLTVNDIVNGVFAKAVDGVTYESLMEVLLAVVSGVAVPSGSNTILFKKRDGTTTKVTITYGDNDGERTGSTIA